MNLGASATVGELRHAAERHIRQAARVEERDALFAVAEFGVGLAGFAAIFVALVRRAGPWETASTFRLELLLLQSLPAGLFAFVPVTLHALGAQSVVVWRLSSLLFAAGHVLLTLAVRLRLNRLPREAREALSGALLRGGYVTSSAMTLLLLINATGWPATPSSGPYLLALVVLLSLAALNFIRTVTTRPPPAA